jgi:hypothetical protein
MKSIRKPIIIGLTIATMTLCQAAPVTWGSWTAVSDNTAIQTLSGYAPIAGVNFNGTTTTIPNGTQDVGFVGIAQNASGSVAGITVATSGFDFASTGGGNSNVVSAVGSPQTWAAALDRVIGDFGAGAAATIQLTGLTSGTTYYVQFFSSAPDGNILANSKITSDGGESPVFGNHGGGGTKSIIATFTANSDSQQFVISGTEPTYGALVIGVQPVGSDTTPPSWTATWPQAAPHSNTSLTVRSRTNEAGNAYYVVLLDGTAAPTAAQVKAGTDSFDAPVSAKGSLALTANAEATATIGSLGVGTAYDVYFVAEDGVPNLQASPVKVDAATLTPDTTPPDWAATWPQAAALSTTSLTVRAKTNEAGIAYVVVLPDGAPAPTAAQVKAGTDSSNAAVPDVVTLTLTADTEAAAPVSNLSPGTAYDVYLVAEDGVPNLQATPVKVDAATLSPDTAPPEWAATWPQAIPLSSTSLSVRAKTNEAGAAYYVVIPDGAPAPTAIQVAVGTDSTGTPVTASGTLPLTANTEATAPVGNLSPNTAYDVFFVAEDAVPNLQAAPVKVDATTLPPDTAPPEWIATWPKAGQLSGTSLTVRAQINEAGDAYYVVLAAGATPPSAAQVKVGTDSADAPALKSGIITLTANTEATATVPGLATDTTYDIYFVAEDTVPNLQAAPSLVSVFLAPPPVLWGDWTSVLDHTAVQVLSGYSTVQGVNLNGSNTTIPNGTVDVSFVGIGLNASGTAAGITVSTSGFDFQSTGGGNSNVVSSTGDPQAWGTVLDRVIGDFGAGDPATFTLSGLTVGSSYYVQFFSSAPDGNILTNSKITSKGEDSPLFGGHPMGGTRSIIASFKADATSQTFTISGSEPTYSALVIGVKPAGGGNTYASWIGGFTGLNGLTGFNDDADFDGLDNGLENFLGTAPNAGNAGLSAGPLSGTTFTFTHPQNATPASDVSAPVYTWSTDLLSWNASGASDGDITVTLTPSTNMPTAGTTTVTATVTGAVPPKLFIRLGVSQQ